MRDEEPRRTTWLQTKVEASILFNEVGIRREEEGLKITFYVGGVPVFSFSRECAINEELCMANIVGELRVIRSS